MLNAALVLTDVDDGLSAALLCYTTITDIIF